VLEGAQPWWGSIAPGTYALEDRSAVLAVGRSDAHHHVAEGWLAARVAARLSVRRAAEALTFSGTMPEPELADFFITARGEFLALMAMPLPEGLTPPDPVEPLAPPPELAALGRLRVGRHVFEGGRHLFLECEVEGPLANPDWGRARVSAELGPRHVPTLGAPALTLAPARPAPR
jgi:hypothetical protein